MDKLTATNISNYINNRNKLEESKKSASKIFKINYSTREQDIIKNIDIKRAIENDYKYCGKYLKILP